MGIFFKRLPGIIYNYRYAFITSFLVIGFFIYLLFYWRFLCTNFEPWRHVKKLCNQYEQNKVVGDLCMPLCIGSTIHSLTCQTFHAGKEVVFSAVHMDNVKMVFKLARNDDSDWLQYLEENNFPTEKEFELMIQNHINSRLNVTVTKDHLKRLARFANGEKAEGGSKERKAEMKQLWHLLQDNEYLIATVFVEKDVFPKVIGSCGPYFAVEYLHPVIEGQETQILTEHEDKNNWSTRVHLAVLILDLLMELENSVAGGFELCDIKPSHFGMSKRSGKLKFLDLDVTLPKAIANTIIADGTACHVDSDCGLFDCKSLCNPATGKCDMGPVNNNLQIVCEKIFLGWKISKRLIMPGLLMSRHTPSQLASLLRQCADPDTEGGTLNNVQDRLITVLSELDRMLAASNYDYYDNKL